MIKEQSMRKHLEMLRTQLESERSSFISHWRDISEHTNPRRVRFSTSDTNKGYKVNQKIIDSTGMLALRTLRSGMMSGITSPARPWFKLTVSDPKKAESQAVKEWLDEVSRRMTTVFLRSNLYNVLPIVYSDMGEFGTACMYMEEDVDDVVRFYPFAVGSYCISNNHKLKVDTFYREFRLTVRQIIQKFAQDPKNPQSIDWSKIRSTTKAAWENGNLEEWVDIRHFIIQNPDYKQGSLLSERKKYISIYYESGTNINRQTFSESDDDKKYLSVSGYDYFPVLAPRWEVNGEDVYGTSCPGMECLGDVKQLQLGEKRGLQAIEKMVNPPMTGPSSLRNQKASILAGDITYIDSKEGQAGFRPVHEVNFRIQELEMKQQQIRSRIQRSFYEDLFLMLAQTDRRQITAREIEERHEEKLLALGPVLEQLNQDLLDPLIDNTFDIMINSGMIPPAPKELGGENLKVEYISIMAQAQKLVGIGAVERFAGFVGQAAAVDPRILDKVNGDQMIDVYSDLVSLPTGIVRTDDEVMNIRSQREQAIAQQQQAEQMSMQAKTAKDLSQSKIESDNGLGMLVDQAQSGQIGNAFA